MVQLPEPTNDARFASIAEMSKERIRQVIVKLERENMVLPVHGQERIDLDLGFRVFRLATSNIRPWEGLTAPTVEEYAAQMALYSDLLVGGWQPLGVIWETAIKEGYGLDARIERVAGPTSNTVYRVTDTDKGQSFLICLDHAIDPETGRAFALTKDDLFICRDMALTDEIAANLALQCRLKTL